MEQSKAKHEIVCDTDSHRQFHPSIVSALTKILKPRIRRGGTYCIYSHTANAARDIYNTTTSVDLNYQITQATKVVMKTNFTWPQMPKHIKTSYENVGMVTVKASKTRNPHKLRARHIILKAAGMNTDLTPCEEQADSNICVNCLAIDNLLNVAINEGVRMAGYYENTFVPVVLPSFVDYFNNEENEARAKAWREDMGMLMDKAATAAANKINEGVNNAVDGLNNFAEDQYEAAKKGYKLQGRLHANATQPISVWRRARKDWDHLFKEWEIRGGKKLIEVLENFLTTTDDCTSHSWTKLPPGSVVPFEHLWHEVIYCSG